MKRRYWNKNGELITDILTRIPNSAYNEAMKRREPLLKHQYGQFWYAPCYPQWIYRIIYKRRRRIKFNKEQADLFFKLLAAISPILLLITFMEKCKN
jgi:hypothetical protein